MVSHCLPPDFFYWFTPTDCSPFWTALATVVNISASSGAETKTKTKGTRVDYIALYSSTNNDDCHWE